MPPGGKKGTHIAHVLTLTLVVAFTLGWQFPEQS